MMPAESAAAGHAGQNAAQVTAPLAAGVIGAGRHGAALADHHAPLPDVRIARWAASPGGADVSATREFAARIGAPFARDWEAVVRDPQVPAVLVLSEAAGATVAAEAALAAGKTVICAVPAATRPEEVNRLAGAASGGRGRLLAGGTVRYSPAGREALRLIRSGELGPLHSVYAAMRLSAAGTAERAPSAQRPVLEEFGWDLLDFLVAVTAAPPSRVHAHVDALFGSVAPDTGVAIVRFADDLIATVEVSRCLPPSIAASPEGEIEIEVIGGRQAVRVQPGATAVTVYGRTGAARPWVDAPVVGMLEDLAAAAAGGSVEAEGAAEIRRAVDLMEAIRAAAGRPAAAW
jgi:predicted dehydrogenase